LDLGVIGAVVQQHSSSCYADDEAKHLHSDKLKTHNILIKVSGVRY
jgi:hypothetical protein